MVAEDVLDLDGSGIGCLEHSVEEVFDHAQPDRVAHQTSWVCRRSIRFSPPGRGDPAIRDDPHEFVNGGLLHTNTGVWTTKAIRATEQFGPTVLFLMAPENQFRSLPDPGALHIPQDASFFHTCANNTVMGTQWNRLPRPPAGVPTSAT